MASIIAYKYLLINIIIKPNILYEKIDWSETLTLMKGQKSTQKVSRCGAEKVWGSD